MIIKIDDLLKSTFNYMKTQWFNKVDDPEDDNSHPGTKFTAERANNIENGVEKAHERLNNITAFLKDEDVIMKNMRFDFLLLKASVTSGLTSNILADNFETCDSINLIDGAHNKVKQQIYLP